jgi:23S rRNA pseudouridine1911/1915/1917 synthase
LVSQIPDISRARVQQLVAQAKVTVNGEPQKSSFRLQGAEKIEILGEVTRPQLRAIAEEIPLDIVYEDDDLAVINKPAGMMVHAGAGTTEDERNRGTLVNALLHHFGTLSNVSGELRPGIVHRLDKETSGCLVAAKNDVAHRHLSKQFTDRTVEKVYLALVAGKPREQSGVIENKIGRHPVHRQRMSVCSPRGRAARTEYRVLRSNEQASLIECKLHSGRTHQIRVHLHHLGNPVLGDKVYAPRFARNFSRQMLHAWKLGFRHPRTGEWKTFEAPLPDDFKEAIAVTGL